MITTVCISTKQQAVNLIPALQTRAEKMYLISSQEAEKQHWTSNLRFVCERRKLAMEVIPIKPEIEMAPDKMVREILPRLSADEDVYWNISGGKKSMTLGLVHAYQQRAKDNDCMIYTENRPYQIVRYTGFQFLDETPMYFFLELEDILNLYGFTSGNTGERLDSITFPEWTPFFSENYRNNRFFQETIARCFMPRAEDARDKQPMLKSVRRILEDHKPCFDNLISSMPAFDDNAVGNIRKKAEDYCNKKKEKRDIAPILKAFNEFYWNKVKDAVIPAIVDELKESSLVLLQSRLNPDQEREFLKVLDQCSICFQDPAKKFLQGNVLLPEKPGSVFEKLTAFEFYRTLTEQNLERFIPHVYIGVKTFRLEYNDKDNHAKLPENIQDHKNDDEFDLTVVMPWGALQIFEAKTYYGEGGDVLKSLRDSAMSKSGVFGRAIFIDHLLEKLRQPNGNLPNFYPQSLIDKRTLIKGMGMRAWGFDEIEKELPKTMNRQ